MLSGGCRHEGTLFPTAIGFKPDGSEFDATDSMVRILDAAADGGGPCWSWMCTWETDLPKLRATHAIELTFIWDWMSDDSQPALQAYAGTDLDALQHDK